MVAVFSRRPDGDRLRDVIGLAAVTTVNFDFGSDVTRSRRPAAGDPYRRRAQRRRSDRARHNPFFVSRTAQQKELGARPPRSAGQSVLPGCRRSPTSSAPITNYRARLGITTSISRRSTRAV